MKRIIINIQKKTRNFCKLKIQSYNYLNFEEKSYYSLQIKTQIPKITYHNPRQSNTVTTYQFTPKAQEPYNPQTSIKLSHQTETANLPQLSNKPITRNNSTKNNLPVRWHPVVVVSCPWSKPNADNRITRSMDHSVSTVAHIYSKWSQSKRRRKEKKW